MVFPDRRTASALLTILLFAIVLGHELDIHPLLAIFTLMVGGAVGGIVGIYLSVPLVAALRVNKSTAANWSLAFKTTDHISLRGGPSS
jgi:predicted PurR-regulated permease PerM